MLLCQCDIAGDPVAKGRPRSDSRTGRTYTPHRTEVAQEAMAWALRGGKVGHGPPATGPITVELAFRCATRRRADIDNFAKLVLDAANGIVYVDDQQVVDLHVTVERGCADPGTRVWIRENP